MKVILVTSTQPVFPFKSALEEMRLAGETLRERAIRQLRAAGVPDPVGVASEEDLGEADFPAFVWRLDTVLSDRLLEELLKAARKAVESFAVAVSYRDHEVLIQAGATGPRHRIGVRFLRARVDLESPTEERFFEDRPDLEVAVGLAQVVHGVSHAWVRAHTLFGRTIRTWVDLHQLSSLICREYSALQARSAARYLPGFLLRRALGSPRIQSRMNRIGRRCRIHPTAVLEGCVVGDDVEIGPFSYLRASWIGSGATIGEHSAIKVSMIEDGAYLRSCDAFNSHIGASSLFVPDILYHSWIGRETFVGGGTGFSDFLAQKGNVSLQLPGQLPGGSSDSGIRFLGSAVGEACFIGSGLLFRPGLAIPAGTRILNSELIEKAPQSSNQVFVARGNKLIQIPAHFLEARPR